jgi:hypothetical protein
MGRKLHAMIKGSCHYQGSRYDFILRDKERICTARRAFIRAAEIYVVNVPRDVRRETC